MEQIAIEKIGKSTLNPRSKIGDVSSLAKSIKAIGLVEPLIVTDNGDGTYELVAGHRRLAAVRKLKRKTVACEIRNDYSEDRSRGMAMLAENLQRQDLDPLEEAQIIFELVNEHGLTQKAVSEAAGQSESWVSERMPLNNLPARVKKLVRDEQMSLGDATHLLPFVDTPKVIAEILDDAEDTNWNVNYHGAISSKNKELEKQAAIAKVQPAFDKLVELGATGLTGDERPGRNWKELVAHQLDVEVRAHRKEACHAMKIVTDSWSDKVNLVEWCMKPANHRTTGASELKATGEDREVEASVERRAENKKQRERKAKVNARKRELVSGRYKSTAMTPFFAEAYVRRSHFDAKKLACQMLEVKPVLTANGPKDWYGTIDSAIKEYGYQRFALAVLLVDPSASYSGIDVKKWFRDQGTLKSKEQL